jgi:heterodisulfide reductase subunit C
MVALAVPEWAEHKAIERNTAAEICQCWTCSSCDIECPVNKATNKLKPQKIVHLANLGFMDELLSLPEIWYCLECKRCDYVCPNLVKPSVVISYLREEAFRRKLVSLEMTQRRRILFSRFQRVRWRAAEQCLNGEVKSISDDRWYDWLRTPVDATGGKISLSDLDSSIAFRHVIDKSSIYSCFNCRECSNACPVSSGPSVFDPLWIFHMVHLGLEEEILKSPSIWLCIACKRCTEACSQLVNGQLVIQRLQEMAIKENIADKDFLFRWRIAQKVIFPRFIKEIDALFMASAMGSLDIDKKIIELHSKQKTIIASGFSESNRLIETQRIDERRPTINQLKASVG